MITYQRKIFTNIIVASEGSTDELFEIRSVGTIIEAEGVGGVVVVALVLLHRN